MLQWESIEFKSLWTFAKKNIENRRTKSMEDEVRNILKDKHRTNIFPEKWYPQKKKEKKEKDDAK